MPDPLPGQRLIDHHRALDTALLALQETRDPVALGHCIAELQRHIYIEEALLFPLINQRRLRMPLSVMRDEHGQMWHLMQQLTDTATTTLTTDMLAQCQQLGALLALHNPKEEDIIYPAIDQYHLTDREPGSLIDDINDAVMPVDWVCAALSSPT